MTCTRFLYNDKNLLKDADVIASDMKPSENAVTITEIIRTGTGAVRLGGTFTGDQDTVYRIKIVTDVSSQVTISEIEFQGIGNGDLTEALATGLDAQDLEVELIDLGTETTYAFLPLYGGILRAVVTGPIGNNLFLSTNTSGITRTDLPFTVFNDMGEDDNQFEGSEYFYGDDYCKPLDDFGNVDPTTKRISFGTDPQVYKMYREWTGYKWIYHITPSIVRPVTAGTIVKEVTGSYSATVSDGIDTDSFPGIITRYDFLNAVLTTASLVTYEGAVSQDYTPEGMATIDFDIVTEPFNLPIIPEGSIYVEEIKSTDLQLSIDPDHPTEKVTIECINNDSVTNEEWSVRGEVSGLRAISATTNILFTDPLGYVAFKIPPREAPSTDVGFRIVGIDYASRGGGEYKPPICPDLLTLGTGALPKTITLEYKERDELADDCECEGTSYEGQVKPSCLGYSGSFSEGGGIVEIEIKKRLYELYKWRNEFIQTNVSDLTDFTGFNADAGFYFRYVVGFGYDRADIDMCKRLTGVFHSALNQIQEHETTGIQEWESVKTYEIGNIVRATNPLTNFYFKCTKDGNSDIGEPPWATIPDIGDIIQDATTEWVNMGEIPLGLWDQRFAEMKLDLVIIEGREGGKFWRNMNLYDTIDLIHSEEYKPNHVYVSPDDHIFPIGTLPPGWPLEPETPINHPYVITTVIGGTSPALPEPNFDLFPYNTHIALGPDTWEVMKVKYDYATSLSKMFDAFSSHAEYFLDQYRVEMDRILVASDLEPIYPFELAGIGSSIEGGLCWQDKEAESHYWEVENGARLPAFNNVVYHSCINTFDEDTGEEVVVPTFEYAFVIKVECPVHLKVGDKITLQITGNFKTYEVGDNIQIPVIFSSPQGLAGGQIGNNLLTWRVSGTVDSFIDYVFDKDSPVPYSDNGLEFLITPGTIPFELTSAGTKFLFSIESGQFQYQRESQPWSGNLNINTGGVPIIDGLEALFYPGPKPSFQIDDLYTFLAEQKYSPFHTMDFDEEFFSWNGSTVTLTYYFGALGKKFDSFALWHSLPEGSTVQFYGSNNGTSWDLLDTLAYNEDLIVSFLSSPVNYRWVRLYLDNATDGKLYHVHVSEAWDISVQPQKVEINDRYAMTSGAGYSRSGRYIGRGTGGTVGWNRWLKFEDVKNIKSMIRYLKENNEEPCIFIPNLSYPDRSYLVKIDTNKYNITDRYKFVPADDTKEPQNRYSVELPLEGIIL